MNARWLGVLVLVASPAIAAEPMSDPVHDKAVERVEAALDAVQATPDQREQTFGLLQEVVPQLQTFREEARTLREEIRAVFQTPTIDRAALEELRLDAVDLFDRTSGFAFEHVADIAEVFSVEQRQQLRALHEKHRADRFARWHGEG